jgi:anti-anti-sigma regulatory factor
VRNTAQSKPRTPGHITAETVAKARILRIQGNLTGPVLAQLDVEANAAVPSGLHVVLDLSQTTHIGADALGSLIHVANLARRYRRDLWMAGAHAKLVKVFDAAQLTPSFRVANKVSEALRRIEPDLVAVSQLDEDGTVIHVRKHVSPHVGKVVQARRRAYSPVTPAPPGVNPQEA